MPPEAVTDQSSNEPAPAAADEEPLIEDLLVEEVSIDGMCGVY